MINRHLKVPASFFVAAVFLSSAVSALSQVQPERVLLIASCATDKDDKCGDVSIHRFAFRGGSLVSQEVLKKVVTDKGYFQGGENRILQNRYAVSIAGAVFDLETKEIYDDKMGSLAGLDERDVFITDFNLVDFTASITYRLDLETKKYSRHSPPNFYSFWGSRGQMSPDGKKLVYSDGVKDGLFVLTKKGRHPSDFSSFRAATGYKATCTKCPSSSIYSVPAVWIDNDRFISQRTNGDLVLFNYATRKWTDVVRIPIGDTGNSPPVFFSDPAGGVYYEADKLYKIDIANRRFAETNDYGLGHGFTVSGRHDLKLFSFEDRKLGLQISGRYVAIDGYLAVEFQDEPLADSRPIGIRVWGKDVGSWTTLRIKYSPRIIGWLTE